MVTKEQVVKIIEKYQPILHLEDWVIKVSLVNKNIITQFWKKKQKIEACIYVDTDEHVASMYVWKFANRDIMNISLEAIIVHELIHIHLDPITHFPDEFLEHTPDGALKEILKKEVSNTLETLINTFTRSILELANDSYTQSVDMRLKQAETFVTRKVKKKKKRVSKGG